ncbi:DUF1802 family protein [Brunnivagina elsteri]|uniref:DUF1802 domain-containing protein n=1 Tax=Brunnivagina elsteri CCALA 953 TaxID=987040 RepID=A0A2A2TDY3_9CYAN|nr:DUF1802 family protein [Calothrix elsteri]PAX51942.1 DUF1802 domain-containing protein [Calothrix elsteri CCALA 953]
MSTSSVISTALCLYAPDIEALIQGCTIVVFAQTFVHPGKKFALYPSYFKTVQLPDEQYYRSSFLPFVQNIFPHSHGALLQPQQITLFPGDEQLQLPLLASENIQIKTWAKCELCQVLDGSKSLDILSKLTVWKKEAFEKILLRNQHIFFTYLRVYHLPQSQEMTATQEKLGKFISLSKSLTVSEMKPVLTDNNFAFRRKQLEQLEPPEHPELEQLQAELEYLKINSSAAKNLQQDIQEFLGWNSQQISQQPNPDLAWIGTIAKLGDRSIELDERKTNYRAGTDFENITRRSLDFLGFKVDTAHKGGAGGLDLFCSQPYPLVCECKAGKLIPSRTVEELIKLGGKHLGKDKFIDSAKLVIGPGKPSSDTLKSAQEWKVSIINAMTLQKLVELHAKYSGSINLFELKQYLEPGQIDVKLEEYIQKIEKEIELRSHIIQVLKNYLEQTKYERAGVEALHAAYVMSKPLQALESRDLHEILIELSSPLTGYLGRIKGEDWRRDRFYFLRDLPVS